MSNIGILGGTFDPFHYGHLSIANTALEEAKLDKLILLPAKVQPFKIGKEMADEKHRVKMVDLIAKENSKFTVSTIETEADEISYTYKTLLMLKKQYPKDELFFILGTDSFLSLEDWYMGCELLKTFSFILGIRPGYDQKKVNKKISHYKEKYNTKVVLLHNKLLEISSTDIKKNIGNGKSIKEYVPLQIERYIDECGLYK